MAAAAGSEFGAEWPEWLETKVVVLDFDRTITLKHTRGAVFHTAGLDDASFLANFADLDFFKTIIPKIARHAKVAIATYADHEEESLLSGVPMIRRYLNLALGEEASKRIVPDDHIEAWNPDNRKLEMSVVGKNKHLDELRSRIAPKAKRIQMVLFDDTERNIVLAAKKGYAAQYCEPATKAEADAKEKPKNVGFCLKTWQEFLAKEQARMDQPGCSLS